MCYLVCLEEDEGVVVDPGSAGKINQQILFRHPVTETLRHALTCQHLDPYCIASTALQITRQRQRIQRHFTVLDLWRMTRCLSRNLPPIKPEFWIGGS